jgi:hypothetical protein
MDMNIKIKMLLIDCLITLVVPAVVWYLNEVLSKSNTNYYKDKGV